MHLLLARYGWACKGTLILVLLLAVGCSGGGVGRVAGQVTLDGQPLDQGAVVFQDTTRGISVNAALQRDGSYVARTHDQAGLPPGTYQVAIAARTFGTGEAPLIAGPPSATAPPPSVIPAKYQDVATSGLSVTVKPGANPPFNFALTR
jgi:hypothetical protein